MDDDLIFICRRLTLKFIYLIHPPAPLNISQKWNEADLTWVSKQ